MRVLVVAAALSLATGGCGGERDGFRSTADEWVAALEAERWPDACALMGDVGPSCPADLRSGFENETIRIERSEDEGESRRFFFTTRGPEGSSSNNDFVIERVGEGYEVSLDVLIVR